MSDIPTGYTLVTEPFYPRCHVWPPGTLWHRMAAAKAYRVLHDRGVIALEKVVYSKRTDVVTFHYLTQEWDEKDDIRALQAAESEILQANGGGGFALPKR